MKIEHTKHVLTYSHTLNMYSKSKHCVYSCGLTLHLLLWPKSQTATITSSPVHLCRPAGCLSLVTICMPTSSSGHQILVCCMQVWLSTTHHMCHSYGFMHLRGHSITSALTQGLHTPKAMTCFFSKCTTSVLLRCHEYALIFLILHCSPSSEEFSL